MKNGIHRFIQILTWLGIMSVLTLFAMGVWIVVWHGSQSTESLKWLQFLQTIGTFLLPPILCAWIWDSGHKPFAWLKMDRGADWRTFVIAVLIMVCAIPAINLLADLNSRIVLPEALRGLEEWMKAREDDAAALTERFLAAGSVGGLLINIGLMALLPAIAEELSFRGVLQGIFTHTPSPVTHNPSTPHLAIWVTAIIFSAIHMQFYGFVPRMLMGAMFGYVLAWTGSLWVPVVMHFTNNGLAVLAYYILGAEEGEKSYADTIGAGTTWWLGLISLAVVITLLVFTYRGLPGYGRRTHKE